MDKRFTEATQAPRFAREGKGETIGADLRTSEQLEAAREVGRAAVGRRNGPPAHYSTPSTRNQACRAVPSTAKADV